MSDQTKKNSTEEIELSVFFQGIKQFFINCLKLVFQVISFFKKHIIVVLILLVGGVVGGYFWDNNFKKNYKNEIIVIPNFESTEYLYDQIEMINSKIKNRDGSFFNEIKFPDYQSLREITIEPITDVYNLVKKEKTNLDVFKLLTEKGDMLKVLADRTSSRYFKYHKINIYEKGSSAGNKNINLLLDYLNQNSFYEAYSKVAVANMKKKLIRNEEMIKQIDTLVSAFNRTTASPNREQLININQNSQLNDLIITKEALISDNKKLELDLIDNGKVIQEVSIINDIIENKIFTSKMFSLPLLLIALFSGVFFLIYLFNSLKKLSSN